MRLIISLAILYLTLGIGYANNVHIQGRWQNGPKIVRLTYMEDAATAKVASLISDIDPYSYRFEFYFELNRPTLLQFRDKYMIVSPGDSMNIHITGSEDNPTLRFEGPHRMEHSFLIRLQAAHGLFPSSKFAIDETSIEKYKVAATHHYDSCILFLRNDAAQKSISESFEKIAQGYLTARYYSDLLYPVSAKLITKDKLPEYYFELVNFLFFKTADLLAFREFILAVANYNADYYADHVGAGAGNPYDSASVAMRIKSANHNFFGEVKDNLLLFQFADLIEHGTADNALQVKTLYDYLTGVFVNQPRRVAQMSMMKHEFDIVKKPLPSTILSQQLRTQKGNNISLKEALGSNEVVYVGFWDSSCEPCIAELQAEKQLMSELDGMAVKFVLISFDDDEKKWRKAITQIKIKGDHYLLSQKFTSDLVKYISFNKIPHYLVFDKRGNLVSREAPLPGDILKDKSVLTRMLE